MTPEAKETWRVTWTSPRDPGRTLAVNCIDKAAAEALADLIADGATNIEVQLVKP
jgi:hypothetical protein